MSYLRDLVDGSLGQRGITAAEVQRQLAAVQRAHSQRLEDISSSLSRAFTTPHHINCGSVFFDLGLVAPAAPERPKTPAEHHASFVARFLEHGADAL